MSFACFIWEYPAPADSAEVDLIRKAYRDVAQPPNPRFVELVKRLTARYPDLMDAETDEELDNNVWSGGPLDTGIDQPVYSLGIVTDHLDTVYPFVCETANALGLNVWNHVDGATHRPDGIVVEFDPSHAQPVLSEEDLDITALRERMNAQLQGVAAANGFKKVGRDFARGIDGGWQSFGSRIREVRGRVVVDVEVDTYVYEVMRLYAEVDPERYSGNANGRTFTLSVHEFIDNPLARLVLREDGALPAMTQAILPFVRDRLLPMADKCRTIKGLDRLMNGRRPYLRQYPLNHLIVSRLLCSPDFDDIHHRLRDAGFIDENRHSWLSAKRELIAIRKPCDDETVFVSSIGPDGIKRGWIGPGTLDAAGADEEA